MIKRLGLLALALWAVLVGLSAAAVAYGRGQSLPESVLAFSFDQCDDLICFKGIVPGKTGPEQTRTLLGQYTGNPIDRLPTDVRVGDSVRVSVLLKNSLMVIKTGDSSDPFPATSEFGPTTAGPIIISHANDKALFPAGWIVARYGAPCRIYVNSIGDDFILHYPFLFVRVRLSGGTDSRLSPDSSVLSLMAEADDSFQCSNEERITVPWRGFASVQRYTDNR